MSGVSISDRAVLQRAAQYEAVVLEVELWYHHRNGEHPDVKKGARSYTDAVKLLTNRGLLTCTKGEAGANDRHTATEALRVYVTALKAIRFPVKVSVWRIPEDDEED